MVERSQFVMHGKLPVHCSLLGHSKGTSSPPASNVPASKRSRNYMMSRVLLLLLGAGGEAHYMWMRNGCVHVGKECTSPRAVITFAETAGSASGLELIDLVKNRTNVTVSSNDGHWSLNSQLEVGIVGEEGADLTAPIPARAPFSLQLTTTFGLYPPGNPSLLIYTASASEPMRPSDWLAIDTYRTHRGDDGQHGARLDISLRDPFMSSAVPGEGVVTPPLPMTASPADQCPPGVAWADDDACVVAVVRFNGTLLKVPHNITTYISIDGEAGTLLRTAETLGGLTVLRLYLGGGETHPGLLLWPLLLCRCSTCIARVL